MSRSRTTFEASSTYCSDCHRRRGGRDRHRVRNALSRATCARAVAAPRQPVSRAGALRRGGRRILLRSRRRAEDRRGELAVGASDDPVRRERGRQDLSAARGRRPGPARADPCELRRVRGPRFVVVTFNSWREREFHAALCEEVWAAVAELVPGFEPEAAALPALLEAASKRLLDAKLLVILDQFDEYFIYHARDGGEGSFAEVLARAVND